MPNACFRNGERSARGPFAGKDGQPPYVTKRSALTKQRAFTKLRVLTERSALTKRSGEAVGDEDGGLAVEAAAYRGDLGESLVICSHHAIGAIIQSHD